MLCYVQYVYENCFWHTKDLKYRDILPLMGVELSGGLSGCTDSGSSLVLAVS